MKSGPTERSVGHRRGHRRHANSRAPGRLLRPLSDRRGGSGSPGISRSNGLPSERYRTGCRPRTDPEGNCRRLCSQVLPGEHGVGRPHHRKGGAPPRLSRTDLPAMDCRPRSATERQIVTRETELEMYLTESAGCGHGCRFCAAGFSASAVSALPRWNPPFGMVSKRENHRSSGDSRIGPPRPPSPAAILDRGERGRLSAWNGSTPRWQHFREREWKPSPGSKRVPSS